MENAVQTAIAALPEALRPSVELWLKQFADRTVRLSQKNTRRVVPVVACSEFAATVIARDIDWFIDTVDSFADAVNNAELDAFVTETASADIDVASLKSSLRRFRNRFLLRVLWRELHGEADLDETLAQLSLLADRMLSVATYWAEKQLTPRFGHARDASGARIPFVILGMGKLGGRELNFSSDIDVIFCYPENGETDGDKSISAQEYFVRLSRSVIALLDEVTADGFVFRVDTRLRPFGDSGPPVVSFAALESYLLEHGRDWERYAYVKARIVGRQPPESVREDLHANLIRPFVYRRYLDYGVFQSVRDMQKMIAADVRRRELADNIKLGPGGIREAEFIVQALQLVRGGNEPSLQVRELQTVLPLLVSERGLPQSDADDLLLAYRYLRRLENFIQAIRDQQTHDLPDSNVDRARLYLAMGHASWAALLVKLNNHRDVISAQFAAIAVRGDGDQNPLRQKIHELWELGAPTDRWTDALRAGGIDDAESLAGIIVEFSRFAVTQQVDAAASQRLHEFVPGVMLKLANAARPAVALRRTLSVVEQILRRSAYLALLNENEPALSRLVDLCEKSQYITEQIARYPILLDELLDARSYSKDVTKSDIETDIQHRLQSNKADDSESKMHAIAQCQRAAMFRIAVADFNGRLPIMKVSDALTWLAEIVLERALQVAWQDMTALHGVPRYEMNSTIVEAGFGVIAYGKLGGLELSYGSDLDVVFLHDSKGKQQRTDGDKPLDNTVFFSRLVRRLTHFLTTQTSSGALYEIDTRLRPDGRSGLLVTSTQAFERYQQENAWTWEHQALLRARAVAGSDRIGREFERIRGETLTTRVRLDNLKDDVLNMRQKMRKELDRSDARQFDVKHGPGGMGDIEFLVQYRVLDAAHLHKAVVQHSDNIRQIDALIGAGLIDRSVGRELQDAYREYRSWSHRLVLDGREALADAEQFAAQRRYVRSLWDDWLA